MSRLAIIRLDQIRFAVIDEGATTERVMVGFTTEHGAGYELLMFTRFGRIALWSNAANAYLWQIES